MTVHTPLQTLRNLQKLYKHGFRDSVTDAALARIVASQAARDESVLLDLERDLRELEKNYRMTSEEFIQDWQAGRLEDTADYMDWNALYQMSQEIRQRLKLLRSEPDLA